MARCPPAGFSIGGKTIQRKCRGKRPRCSTPSNKTLRVPSPASPSKHICFGWKPPSVDEVN
eukprot:8496688-Pyramimonas_sp.AAC.1